MTIKAFCQPNKLKIKEKSMMQLRSGSSEIRSTTLILWLWRPGVEAILGGCGHAPTGIDLNADAAVQSGRQMRRTRPRVPGPFLGTTTAAGLQEQPRRSFFQDGFEAEATGAVVGQFEDIS